MLIKYSNLDQLTKSQEFTLKKIVENEAEKITCKYPDIDTLNVIVKVHEMEGKVKKFSVMLRVNLILKVITAHEHAWDIQSAAHRAVSNLRKELEHHYSKESSPWHKARKEIKKYTGYLTDKFRK